MFSKQYNRMFLIGASDNNEIKMLSFYEDLSPKNGIDSLKWVDV